MSGVKHRRETTSTLDVTHLLYHALPSGFGTGHIRKPRTVTHRPATQGRPTVPRGPPSHGVLDTPPDHAHSELPADLRASKVSSTTLSLRACTVVNYYIGSVIKRTRGALQVSPSRHLSDLQGRAHLSRQVDDRPRRIISSQDHPTRGLQHCAAHYANIVLGDYLASILGKVCSVSSSSPRLNAYVRHCNMAS